MRRYLVYVGYARRLVGTVEAPSYLEACCLAVAMWGDMPVCCVWPLVPFEEAACADIEAATTLEDEVDAAAETDRVLWTIFNGSEA